MTAWADYRKCPVCFAPIGEPCLVLAGRTVDEEYRVRVTDEERDRAHTSRELTVAARGER